MAEAAVYGTPSRAVVKTGWLVVAICTIINMLDGVDVLAISFTAPSIAAEWGLAPTQLGILFSAGLAGMTVGSLALSPLADVIGRRSVLLLCLATITAAMLASAFAGGLAELALFRFVTGLGIGGILSSMNTITAEYAPAHRRSLAISIVTMGYPVGATLGGIAAIPLIEQFGWQSVFLFGGVLSLAMIPIVWFALPESLSFLLSRQPNNALRRANEIMQKLERPQLAALPQATDSNGARKGLLDVLGPDLRIATILICSAYFLNMLSFYFVMSWTPKVVVDMGLPGRVGIMATVLINLVGVAGGLLCGWLGERYGLARVTGAYMLLNFVAMVMFALMPAAAPPVLGMAALLGFFMMGTMVGLYATVAHVFPTHVRATGTGAALGIGRLGAVAGPYLGGLLIAAGWGRPAIWAALGLPLLLAALVTAAAARRRRTIEAI